jgi:tetratricopeptide (TPR) repeat protein
LKPLNSILLLAAFQAAWLFGPSCAEAQRPGPASQPPRATQPDAATGTVDLLVTIRDERKGELSYSAKVTLRTRNGDPRGVTISDKGRARFRSVPLGEYEVLVEAPGHATLRSNVSLARDGESHHLDITVIPAPDAPGANVPPPLSLREQKELTAGLRSLQAEKLREAKKHFLSAAKTAPNHPDVDYLLGVIGAMTGEMETAKQYFENSATRYQHVLSIIALGEILLVEGNLDAAEQRLETALKIDPNSWRADQLLAAVLLNQRSYAPAIQHAEHALQLGKTEAKGARLTLAQALLETGERQRSLQVLNELLSQNPTQEQANQARKLLGADSGAADTGIVATQKHSNTPPPTASTSKFSHPVKFDYASLPFEPSSLAAQYQRWVPPNVDDAVPPVETGMSCPIQQILSQTGARVVEFAKNVDRFSATETMNHEGLNEFGLAVHSERRSFNYLVSIQEFKPGVYDVQEFRDGLTTPDIFPEHVATVGTVALVFVFHPNYANDFEFRCEGRTHQGGQDAWQIHFSQKPDLSPRLRSYRLANLYFRVGLKGRAWISTETFQVLRLESDLIGTVPQIRLHADHEDIQYAPVLVKRKELVLWLPASSEIFLDFNGHRIHRQQQLSDYFFFWID